MERGGYVYILTNKSHSTLYTGVTSALYIRISEHKQKVYPSSFTAKYNVSILVYYEFHSSIEEAIMREKFIKGKKSNFKVELINSMNPDWKDLYNEVDEM